MGDFLIMFTYTVASHKILAIIKTFKKEFVKKKIKCKVISLDQNLF